MVMIVSDLVRAGILAVLIALIVTDLVTIPTLIVTIVAIGIMQTLFDSASQAIIPAVVGRDPHVLARVNGRFWAADVVGRSLLGPPLGSGLFVLGRALPFLADLLTFLASAVLVSRLPHAPPSPSARQPVGRAIRAGLRHLRHTPTLLILSLSLGAYNLAFNVAIATFVLDAQERLGISDFVYGLLLTAMGLGGVMAGWLAPYVTGHISWRTTYVTTIATQAVVWTGVALTPSVYAIAVLFVLQGAASTICTVIFSSARQILTPDHLIGRVVSTFRIIGVGAAALGALLGGTLAATTTLQTAQLTTAAISLTAAIVTFYTWRQVDRQPRDHHTAPASEPNPSG
jgi:predicted MFS family arabinose efflux permease